MLSLRLIKLIKTNSFHYCGKVKTLKKIINIEKLPKSNF